MIYSISIVSFNIAFFPIRNFINSLNHKALDRALNGRLRNIKLNSNDSQKLNQLTIHPTSLQFELSKLKIEQTHGAKVQEGNARASPTSIGLFFFIFENFLSDFI